MADMVADTDPTLEWLKRSTEEWFIDVRGVRDQPKPSIFRVPKTLLEENRGACIPQVISLGPLHFLNPELEEMETEKTSIVLKIRDRFSHEFQMLLSTLSEMLLVQGEGNASELSPLLHQSQISRLLLEDFFSKAIAASKDCYDSVALKSFFDTHREAKDLALAWIMFRDACFILEFLKYFDSEDNGLYLFDIVKDIVKLQNQIPLSLIEALYLHTSDQKSTFRDFVISKCNMFNPILVAYPLLLESDLKEGSHLLDCIRKIVVWGPDGSIVNNSPSHGTPNTRSVLEGRQRRLRSAVELKKAGIKFEGIFDGSIASIKFDKRTSTLHLPAIYVGILAETVMINLIAYELYSSACEEKSVTSYAHFMNDLIDSGKDVTLLTHSGVIFHELGSDENVAKLCNTLSTSTSRPSCFPIDDATRGMKEVYEKRKFRILWSEFKEDYFGKPWVFISAVAATLLLLMTVAQVVCLFYRCNA